MPTPDHRIRSETVQAAPTVDRDLGCLRVGGAVGVLYKRELSTAAAITCCGGVKFRHSRAWNVVLAIVAGFQVSGTRAELVGIDIHIDYIGRTATIQRSRFNWLLIRHNSS